MGVKQSSYIISLVGASIVSIEREMSKETDCHDEIV